MAALLRSAVVLLAVAVCADALFIDDEIRNGMRKLPDRLRSDLCTQKEDAKKYCYSDDSFDESLCGQSVVTAWLNTYNTEAQQQYFRDAQASWEYLTNITQETMEHSNKVSSEVSEWFVTKMIEAMRFPVEKYDQETQNELIRITTTNSLCDTTEQSQLIEVNSKLAESYSTIRDCFSFTEPSCLTGQSEFAAVMSVTEDYDHLKELWVKYTNGAKGFRHDFTTRLNLLNKGAKENGWPDNGYYEWFTDVGDEDFLQKMKDLLKQIDPLYREFHAYVRHKLSEKYTGKIDVKKAIPVHLTRNMYGQTWGDLIKLVKPYPEEPDMDITDKLVEKGYNTTGIFTLSEDFFASLGCSKMTQLFWEKSMLDQPVDRTVDCHGSAWDFQLKDDYRVKMCTKPTMSDFTTVHHEMGHIQYFMEYRKQRFVHRDGAQSGFHEAIGDTITLSVLTPEHLKSVGLLDTIPTSDQYDINVLMTTALDKLPFFSFSLMMDLWRWGTYDKSIREEDYNKKWWEMRLEMGGIAPPAEEDRSSEDFFDPGAKFHVTNNVPYIRYFMSFFLQFQFYEAMCNEAGYKGDLHRCDFAGSKEAGDKLRKLMAQGRSTNWHEQLYEMTGSRDIKADSILRYFDKLNKWLINYNRANNVYVGWEGEEVETTPAAGTTTPIETTPAAGTTTPVETTPAAGTTTPPSISSTGSNVTVEPTSEVTTVTVTQTTGTITVYPTTSNASRMTGSLAAGLLIAFVRIFLL